MKQTGIGRSGSEETVPDLGRPFVARPGKRVISKAQLIARDRGEEEQNNA
ncbi:MAG TPA: hypothetical protein VGI60_00780 [Chthoniobacterales bacterium]